MENPDLVLQETGSRPTYSRLNYVPSGDTLRRDAISSFDGNLSYPQILLMGTCPDGNVGDGNLSVHPQHHSFNVLSKVMALHGKSKS